MTKQKDIDLVLGRMSELLQIGSSGCWADALEECRRAMASDQAQAKSMIVSMYGGMGSLNDVVLYQHGRLMQREINEFDALRAELYQLCR